MLVRNTDTGYHDLLKLFMSSSGGGVGRHFRAAREERGNEAETQRSGDRAAGTTGH